MDPLDAIDAASATLAGILDQVGPDQMDSPTPCDAWNVRELINHLAMGNEMSIAMMDGATQEEVTAFTSRQYAGDVRALCRSSIEAQLIRFHEVDDWDVIVHHLIGDIPASQLLGFRITDLALHAWDLASAIGSELRLSDDLAIQIYEFMKPMEPFIATVGVFGDGPSGAMAADADLQQRLLDLTGRRP